MNPLARHVITLARQADNKPALLAALAEEGLAYEVDGADVAVPAAGVTCLFRWSGIYFSFAQESALVDAVG